MRNRLNTSEFKYDGRGYYYLYAPEHPLANKSGKVRLHRYLASLSIGRWLSPEEHVHHRNHNREDNYPSNYQILTAKEHGLLHSTGSIEERLNECKICAKPTKNISYCSNDCKYKGQILFSKPTKEEVQEIIWSMPYTKAGKLLGMSDVGVRKLAIRLGCIMPPARFHTKSKEYKERIKQLSLR